MIFFFIFWRQFHFSKYTSFKKVNSSLRKAHLEKLRSSLTTHLKNKIHQNKHILKKKNVLGCMRDLQSLVQIYFAEGLNCERNFESSELQKIHSSMEINKLLPYTHCDEPAQYYLF